MIALLSLAAYGQTTAHPVTICVDYDIEFVDNGNEDFWTDNSVHRPARGVQLRVSDDSGLTQVFYVDDLTGCYSTNVQIASGNKSKQFTVGVVPRALQKGVPYEVHAYDHPTSNNRPVVVENHVASATFSQVSIVTSSDIQWQVMGAASWIFHRNRFNRTNGPTRSCCVPGAADPDGTCGNPSQEYGAPVTDTLHYFVDTAQSSCPSGGGNNFDGLLNSVHLHSVCASKWLIAHETGHAIVGMRMAGTEAHWSLRAPLDNCMGDTWWHGADVDSGGGADERGQFTKEYGSQSFREGWAEFFATWAWNSRTEPDCTYVARRIFSDFDLNGTLDNDFLPWYWWNDYEVDCAGDPWVGSNTSTVTDGVNWLDDLETASDPAGCARTTATQNGFDLEDNRSTVWDVTRMFWELTSTSSIGPAKLADLYVDMCPRTWSTEDEWAAPTQTESRPLERFMDSASAPSHSGVQTDAHGAANAHIDH